MEKYIIYISSFQNNNQKIDGKKLKENVFYTLKNGKFTETE